MIRGSQNIEKAYHFLVDRELKNEPFSCEELSEAVSWKISSVKTYISKKWKSYLIEEANNRYLVNGISKLSVDDFIDLHTQVVSQNSVKNSSEKYCCVNCFQSIAIQNFIQRKNIISKCDFCKALKVNVAPVTDVGIKLLERIPYEPLSLLTEYEKKENINLNPEPVFKVLLENNVFSNNVMTDRVSFFHLLSLLIPKGGHQPILENSEFSYYPNGLFEPVIKLDVSIINYSLKNRIKRRSPLHRTWNLFKGHIKTVGRFFEFNPAVDKYERLDVLKELFDKCCITVKKDTIFYRCRIVDDHFFDDYYLAKDKMEFLYKQVGPPPSSIYQPNRMNPPGIPYLYISSDSNTCIAETNPEVGSVVLVSTLTLKQDLNIIDLLLPYRHGVLEQLQRYSQVNTEDICSILYWGMDFLQDFSEEISKPIQSKRKELDYIPTQVISEYIRFCGYQGFRYSSSQVATNNELFGANPAGVNYTYFAGPFDQDLLEQYRYLDYEYDPSLPYERRVHSYADWFNLSSYEFLDIKEVKFTTQHSASADWKIKMPRLGFNY